MGEPDGPGILVGELLGVDVKLVAFGFIQFAGRGFDGRGVIGVAPLAGVPGLPGKPLHDVIGVDGGGVELEVGVGKSLVDGFVAGADFLDLDDDFDAGLGRFGLDHLGHDAFGVIGGDEELDLEAVGLAGLGHECPGLGNVLVVDGRVLPIIGQARGEDGVGPLGRAVEGGFHDVVHVDGVAEGLAEFQGVKGGMGDGHAQPIGLHGRLGHHLESGVLFKAFEIDHGGAAHVDFSGLEGGFAGGIFHNGDELQGGGFGGRAEVVGKGLEGDLLFGFPAFQLIGAGAHGVFAEGGMAQFFHGLFGNDVAGVHGEQGGEEVDHRGLEDDFHGVVVHDFHMVQLFPLALFRGFQGRIQDPFIGEFHVGCGHLAVALVEFDPLFQVEDHGLFIRSQLPGFGQVRGNVPGSFLVFHQTVEEAGHDHQLPFPRGHPSGVEGGDVLPGCDS